MIDIGLKDRMRQWARQLVGAARPNDLLYIAQSLDQVSQSGATGGVTYYANAEMLRMLAEETEQKETQANLALTRALASAKIAETRYSFLLDEHNRLLDDGNTIAELRHHIARQADEITDKAREIEALTRKLSRATKKYDALGRVVVNVLEQVQEHEEVALEFVYGDFGREGIDVEVASDLGVGCVLGKGREDDSVHSHAGR